MDRHHRRATRAVRHLAADPRRRTAFRDDPAAALARWRLDTDQLAAIKRGDAASLAGAGVDLTRLDDPPLSVRARRRVLLLAAAVLGLVGGPLAGGAAAAPRIRARRFGIRHVRADALGLRASMRKIGPRAGRAFGARTRLRARTLLGPDRCEFKCEGFELVP